MTTSKLPDIMLTPVFQKDGVDYVLNPFIRPGECWVLDAPGITGMGANSIQRMKDHVEAGGQLVRRFRLEDGLMPLK